MKSLLIALVFAVAAIATPSAFAVTKADVIANVSHNVILKTYEDFGKETLALQKAVEQLIANPTQSQLENAQTAWKRTRYAYEVSEGFLFGPMDALGIDPMIDTWPLELKDLKAILKGSMKIDTEFVRSLNSNVQGFHAIEYILFGEGITTNTRDVATITERDFQYLKASTELLGEQVALLLFAWTNNYNPEDPNSLPYITVISQPNAENPAYTTESAVIQEFVNGIAGIVAEAGKAKLPDATGENPEDANSSLEESPFSWNSINDFTSNVDSVMNIYTGTYGAHKGAGLKDLVALVNPELAARTEAQMIQSRQLILAIPGANKLSFGQAIKDQAGRQRIFSAIRALGELQKTLEEEVAPVLENI